MPPDRCGDCGQFKTSDHECPDFGPTNPCANPACEKTHKNAKYCSQACQYEARKGRTYVDRTRECVTCSEPTDNEKYCSPDCMYEARRTIEPRDCKRCGERFRPKNDQTQYCSRECWDSSRSERAMDVDETLSQQDYVLADGHLIFTLDSKMVKVREERWEAICRDYSEYGGDMTSAEVARRHGIPAPWLRRALRKYGQYKASPPMSRERIARAEDLEPLVAEAVENKEYELLQRIESRGERKIRREWCEMKERLLGEKRFREAAEKLTRGVSIHVDGASVGGSEGAADYHVPTADVHIGSYVWAEEGFGENYDTDLACQRLKTHGRQAAAWIASQGGARTLYRTDLGDLFHALTEETEHGTRLDQDTRGARVWALGLEAMIENITVLSEVAEKTRVIMVPGNHDSYATHQLRHSVALAFRDSENVEVEVSPHRYASFRVGETQHVLDHGYRLGRRLAWKATATMEGVARQFWEDFEGAEHIYSYVGHLHKRDAGGELSHHEIIRLDALTEPDDYATSLRFASRPTARIYKLDDAGRHDTEKVLHADALQAA